MSGIVKYMAGDNEVSLTAETVREYLVNGNGKVTDQEVMMFLALCKSQRLNPFLREVYLIKYGSEPAVMVTGKETFLKRAVKNPHYRGHKTGISDDGKVAWAEVHHEKYKFPIRIEVDYDEYFGRKKDGMVNKMWGEKPKTMLKKVALVQALRETFPDNFGGMYSQEEISSIDSSVLPKKPIETKDVVSSGESKNQENSNYDTKKTTDRETDAKRKNLIEAVWEWRDKVGDDVFFRATSEKFKGKKWPDDYSDEELQAVIDLMKKEEK